MLKGARARAAGVPPERAAAPPKGFSYYNDYY